MYEYLLENLISYSQVDGNLRRTADRGLVSELYRKQMNALALKYFGVNSNGNYTENKEDIVAYRCPYSGEIISDLSTAHLEHILPVSSNGGTILFNCIPILDKVNLSKKDEPNLLVWWQGKGKEYFSHDRLERLIQYMLEAYTLAFKEPTEEELFDYDNSLSNDDYIEKKDDLSVDSKDIISNKTNTNVQQNITYYQLINDLINELSKNRDVSKYNSQLNSLKEQNTFGNIDELEKVVNAVQTAFKEVLGVNSKKYLSYSLKVDMNRLLKSLKTKDYKSEIRKRLKLIEQLLSNNEKQIEDFFESIQDIEESNLLYYDNPSQSQVNWFINNLKVSHETKIKIFIDMLSDDYYTNYIGKSPDKNNIFIQQNIIPFKGFNYQDGVTTKFFWHGNSLEIINAINQRKIELENSEFKTKKDYSELIKLKKALKAIENYNVLCSSNPQARIEIFIDMLSDDRYTSYIDGNPDKNNIFKQSNRISFKGYEHIKELNTSYFWSTRSFEIKMRIKKKIEELESKSVITEKEKIELSKLNTALKAIEIYNEINRRNKGNRIEIFIEMLSKPQYTNYIDGYPDNNNIFSATNKIPFEGNENINTSAFWNNNSEEIKKAIEDKICILEKENVKLRDNAEELNKLKKAQKAIADFEFVKLTSISKRIEKFIEMLCNEKYTNYINGVPDENNIFYRQNKIPFDGYEHINGLFIKDFFSKNALEIMRIMNYKKMVLEKKEQKTDEDYFQLSKLNLGFKAIDDYNMLNHNVDKERLKVFIEMLRIKKYTNYDNEKPDKNNILSKNNEIPFMGFEHLQTLNTRQFWNSKSTKQIIPMLFYNKMYDGKNNSYINSEKDYSLPEYDSARNAIMEYLNYNRRKKKQPEFKTIDEYIDTLDKTKKEVKSLIELRDSLLLRKEQLSIENQELTEELNSSYRRAM